MDYSTLKNLVKFLDQSLIGVIIVDLELQVKYINQNYEIFFLNTFGYKLEEGVQLKGLDVGQENILKEYIDIFETVFRGESLYDSNQNFYGNIVDEQNKIVGGYSINSGMYYNQTDKLKQLVKIASTENLMLAKANHELRTPLVSIVGSAQLLDLSIPKSDEYKQYRQHIKCILQSSEHLKSMIDDFMDYSKLTLGKVVVNKIEKINVNKIINKCINIMNPIAQSASIEICKVIDPGIHYIIKGDSNRLIQVLINLISNAIKYNKNNGKVLIECKLIKGSNVNISIVDTGIGISEEDQQKLFQAYTRFGSKIDKVEGTGLGLNVAKKLIVAMNGKIYCKSKLDVGTRFTIVFPLDSTCVPLTTDKDFTTSSTKVDYVLYIDDKLDYFVSIKNYFDIRYSQKVKLLVAIGLSAAKKIYEYYKPVLILTVTGPSDQSEFTVPIITITPPIDMDKFLESVDKHLSFFSDSGR
jgi:signal transduction histidine kinase